MSSQLGNEMPIPFGIISETYINQLLKIKQELKAENKCHSDTNQCDLYECELLKVLNRLVDIDCDHSICYIDCNADMKTTDKKWTQFMEAKFCLTKPIFHVSCELNPNCENEILTKLNACPVNSFDIIIVKNCIQHISQPERFIHNIFAKLSKANDLASILVVQRLFKTNVLPFYSFINKEWSKCDLNIESLIKTLTTQNFDVNFNIECLECDLSKMNWLFSMADKDIYPLNCIKYDERNSNEGVREICEGIFKYNDDHSAYVFHDRMAFLKITRSDNYFKLKDFKMNPAKKNVSTFKPAYDMFDTIFELNSSLKNRLTQ
jgi:hypothetical protein